MVGLGLPRSSWGHAGGPKEKNQEALQEWQGVGQAWVRQAPRNVHSDDKWKIPGSSVGVGRGLGAMEGGAGAGPQWRASCTPS